MGRLPMGGDQYIVEGLRGRSQWPPATPCYAYGAKNLRLDQRDADQAGLMTAGHRVGGHGTHPDTGFDQAH